MNPSWPGPLVLLPADLGLRIDRWGSTWGILDLKFDESEQLVTIVKFSNKSTMTLPYAAPWEREHYLHHAEATPRSGVWYRCDPELHDLHTSGWVRRLGVPLAEVSRRVLGGWRQPPASGTMLAVALSRADDGIRWSAWWVSRDAASPAMFAIVQDDRQPVDFLREVWPVDELAAVHVTVVGVGSIGSGATESLASSAVGRLALVDPDRLLQHNLPRHRLTGADLGRFKVNAMGDRLSARYPGIAVERYPLSVIEDADVMRPLFARSDVVLCTSDGVASRRVANHLARRAGVPIVLAAVLEDGAFGEVIRVRPRTGCLLCHRKSLEEAGVFDPEPGLDRGYGEGNPHRPMTAAPADLMFMSDLATKVTLATLLEARGRWHQRLPGDWAVVGLQPTPDMPAPFDLERSGEIRWGTLPSPRSDCPTCATP